MRPEVYEIIAGRFYGLSYGFLLPVFFRDPGLSPALESGGRFLASGRLSYSGGHPGKIPGSRIGFEVLRY